MHGDEAILEAARNWLGQGRQVALATVLRTWGSAPREAGSHMAVNDQGEFLGSVSGGCVENAVIDAAREVIQAGAARTLSFGVTNQRAWEVGLACGGTVEILVAPLTRPELLTELLLALRERRPVVAATRLTDGAQILLSGDEPSAAAGQWPHAAARQALEEDRSFIHPTEAEEVFLRPYLPPVRLVIVGGVHIAAALADMATVAGFDVYLVDPRSSFATAARFPGVQRIERWPEEALAQLRPDRRTAVVTLTHEPRLDDDALAAALATEAFYLGALGSRKTHAARLARLRTRGFSDAALARIHGPVGLALGARTPAEIAVSILAEVVAARRGGMPAASAG